MRGRRFDGFSPASGVVRAHGWSAPLRGDFRLCVGSGRYAGGLLSCPVAEGSRSLRVGARDRRIRHSVGRRFMPTPEGQNVATPRSDGVAMTASLFPSGHRGKREGLLRGRGPCSFDGVGGWDKPGHDAVARARGKCKALPRKRGGDDWDKPGGDVGCDGFRPTIRPNGRGGWR